MTIVSEKQNIKSSLKKVNEDARSIYKLLMSDLTSTDSRLKLNHCHILPCNDIKEVFDIKTRFNILFESNWSHKTICEINSGMSGLILDEFDNENVFSKEVFDRFFLTINKFISNNKVLNALMLHKSIEEIEKKYKNRYKLVEIKEVFVDFERRKDGNIIPNICIEIQLERK